MDIIAKTKQNELKEMLAHRSVTETEHILLEATSKSSALITENERLLKIIQEQENTIHLRNITIESYEKMKKASDSLVNGYTDRLAECMEIEK